MKTNRWIRFAEISVLLIGLLTLWNLASIGQGPAPMPGAAWEYKLQFAGNDEDHLGPLNKLGADGWEMVTAYNTGPVKPVVYVFKRAKK